MNLKAYLDFNDAPTQFEHQPKTQREIDENRKNPAEAFEAEMAVHGLYPGGINTDGEMHRFKTGDRSDKSGYYALHVSNHSHGLFGDFASEGALGGNGVHWRSVTKYDVSSKEWKQYEQEVLADKKRLREEKDRRHKISQEKVQKKWEAAKEADPNHPYLKKKQVGSYGGLRQGYGKVLLIPIRDNKGVLWSVQSIYDGGKKKRFEKDCKIQGCSFTIPGNDDLYLCEGYATGATIHEATEGTVIVAFDSGNLSKVAQQITKPFTICADNDDSGIGMDAAKKAQRATKELCSIVMPTFKESNKGTDFNDLFVCEGVDVVKTQLKVNTYTSINNALIFPNELITTNYPPQEVIFGGWLEDPGITLVSGAPGCGKTWFVLSTLIAITRDISFAGWDCEKPVRCLYLDGEMKISNIQKRLKQLDFNKKTKQDLIVLSNDILHGQEIPEINLNDANMREYMRKILIKNKIKVWAFDNISCLTYGMDENSKQEWDAVNQWLIGLRHDGIHSIGIHHLGKSGVQRGTSAREGNIDAHIILTHPRGYHAEDGVHFDLNFEKGRAEDPACLRGRNLKFRLDDKGKYVWTHSFGEGKKQLDVQIVVDILQEMGGIAESQSILKLAIMDQTEDSGDQARKLIIAAVKKGKIIEFSDKNKFGQSKKYGLPNDTM